MREVSATLNLLAPECGASVAYGVGRGVSSPGFLRFWELIEWERVKSER